MGAAGQPYNCPLVLPTGIAVSDGYESGFVAGLGHGANPGAVGAGEAGEYDDIVGWMTMDELVSGLAERGALPAQLWPPIGLEQ